MSTTEYTAHHLLLALREYLSRESAALMADHADEPAPAPEPPPAPGIRFETVDLLKDVEDVLDVPDMCCTAWSAISAEQVTAAARPSRLDQLPGEVRSAAKALSWDAVEG
jgi:hypothetical protein